MECLWNRTGYEARNVAAKKGIVLHKDVSTFSQTKKFEIITLWHVLEHVENLSEFISKFRTIYLLNFGTLIIAVPNYKS